jgi:glycosyltransferase involved in cell wall biosynthesis
MTWELLVVDNNCTDGTQDVMRRFQSRLPLRTVTEQSQGQSHARNRAIACARGHWIVWTDDDVLVDPNWLHAYAAALERKPDGEFLGGTIRPAFEARPPDWLARVWSRVSGAYAVLEREESSLMHDAKFLPYGANFAVRSDVQRRYLYRTDIGRIGNGHLRGDELDVLLRMLKGGHRGYWVPDARVQHIIPADRLTLQYLRSYYHGAGVTAARLARADAKEQPAWQLWPKAIANEAMFYVLRLTSRPEWWMTKLVRASFNWGRLAEQRAA